MTIEMSQTSARLLQMVLNRMERCLRQLSSFGIGLGESNAYTLLFEASGLLDGFRSLDGETFMKIYNDFDCHDLIAAIVDKRIKIDRVPKMLEHLQWLQGVIRPIGG